MANVLVSTINRNVLGTMLKSTHKECEYQNFQDFPVF